MFVIWQLIDIQNHVEFFNYVDFICEACNLMICLYRELVLLYDLVTSGSTKEYL